MLTQKMPKFCAILIIILTCFPGRSSNSNINGDNIESLSRRKRYLVFPDGSSLQLVSCYTDRLITATRNFVFANTIALAWELPHEIVGILKTELDKKHRKVDKTKIVPIDDVYNNRPTYNSYFGNSVPVYKTIPTVTYRPIGPFGYDNFQFSPSYQQSFRRKDAVKRPFYATNKGTEYREPVAAYVHPVYNKIHRRTRRDLFSKLEQFFIGQRKDGLACVLKSVCEVSQASDAEVGTFMQEIIKAIFRIEPHRIADENDTYDSAANKSHNCSEMHPTCDFNIWNNFE